MPCHSYKAPTHLGPDGTRSTCNVVGTTQVALALIACFVTGRPALAQGWCDPSWSTPHYIYGPVVTWPAPYVVHRPTAQTESPLTGPMLPPLTLPESPPVITNYPPADGIISPQTGTTGSLDDIPGEFRLATTESFLNRLLSRTDTNSGPVQDFILGANVTGEQSTESRITVDVRPNEGTARVFLQLSGATVNQTVGVTPQAAIRSRGTHQFRITKQIDFDGLRLTTRTPAAWVTPRLTNEGAVTPMSGVPLIGPLATQIALTEAERRRPVTEQVISQRVTDQVAPRFNRQIDQQLGAANDRLQSAIPRLLDVAGLTPSDPILASTEDRLLLGLLLPSAGNGPTLHRPALFSTTTTAHMLRPIDESTGGNSGWVPVRHVTRRVSLDSRAFLPPPRIAGGEALAVGVHEQFVNHLLDRASLEGRHIPDRTMDRFLALVGDLLSDATLGQLTPGGIRDEDPEFATILLAEENPLSVHFESGQMIVTAHAGFRPVVTPEVPPQRIEIPFTLTQDGGQFTLVPGSVRVDPLSGDSSSPMTQLAGPVIRQQIEGRLRPVTLPRSFPLELPGLSATTLLIREVVLSDGWIVISID